MIYVNRVCVQLFLLFMHKNTFDIWEEETFGFNINAFTKSNAINLIRSKEYLRNRILYKE
jgi:hypothetical protein